jgi:transcriptional regulator with XRE-family HTH domain
MRKSVHTAEYEALRDELRSAREAAGLSQRDLAVALDVPHSVIAKIESGERRVDVIELCWFLAACRADVEEVLCRIAGLVARAPQRRKGRRAP